MTAVASCRAALEAAFRFRTPEDCLAWAQRELYLPKRVTPEPGAYRLDSRPYVKEVFNALQDGKTHTVVLCWGTQTGKTLTVGVWIAFRLANDPAPILLVMPTESLARSYSETRLRPLLDSSPSVRAKYPANRDGMKLLEMHLSDSTLNLVGSNSPGQTSSRPVEILICDEIDKFALATDRESSALHLVSERTKAFLRARHVFTSTPTAPYGDIWLQFLRGTQERFHIQCPLCGKFNYMDFRRDVRWNQEARFPNGKWDLARVASTARWHCPDCGEPMNSAQKVDAMQCGIWKASNSSAEPGVRSFHLNSLYSPTVTFGQAAVKFLSTTGDPAALQNFVNGWLAEPFEERGTGADDEDIISCRGIYQRGECPIEPAFVTLCADPGQQQTHWSAVAWTELGEGYVIDYGKVLAPEDLGHLSNSLKWETPSGKMVQAGAGLIDSGDFTERIYRICAEIRNEDGIHIFYPSKGSGARDGRELVRAGNIDGQPTLMLYTYTDYHLKVSLYIDRLNKKLAPRFWFPMNADNEFLRGHMGQRLVAGRLSKRKEWRKVDFDHYGDCSKLHLASSVIVLAEFDAQKSTWALK